MMTTAPAWDYSALAPYYELRADYAWSALEHLLSRNAVSNAAHAVDIGAGTGRLTRWLAQRGQRVEAIEPCTPMRQIGSQLCAGLPVRWHAREGEDTGLASASARLISYGSSFNVLDPEAAIDEALRLLGGSGQVLLVWNHRDVGEPLQARVEGLIRAAVPDYATGSRRADPLPTWRRHAHVVKADYVEAALVAEQTLADFIAGFRAHATLIRQIGSGLEALLTGMQRALAPDCPDGLVRVPFYTRAWCLSVARPCS